jgi:hypothetical protein
MATEALNLECSKCRAEVFPGACFCMQCGSRLEQPSRLPSSVRLTAQRPAAPRQRVASETGYSIASDERRAAGATRYSITMRRVERR